MICWQRTPHALALPPRRDGSAHRTSEHDPCSDGDRRPERRLGKPASDTRQASTTNDDVAGDGHNEPVR
jgi:hypothetical protein